MKSVSFQVILYILAICIPTPVSAETAISPSPTAIPKEWKPCDQNSDCVIVEEECYRESINKKSAEEARDYFRQWSAVEDCVGPDQKEHPTAQCVGHNCVLLLK